jgi:cobalt-zinc-cadmium efflux system outer membrane protein
VARTRVRLGTGARAAASVPLAENPDLELTAGPRWSGKRSDYDFSASLSQPIEIAGERGARQRAAARFEERLGAEADLTDFGLQIELAAAYRTAQLARAQERTAQRSLDFTRETRSIVERRVNAGESTIIELRVADGDLARAERDLNLARQSLRSATLELCALSGWPVVNPPLVAAELPALRQTPNVARLLELASLRHPELRVRKAALAQARAETDLAAKEGWPAPALGAELSREGGVDGAAEWIVLGTLRLPLPLWQRNQAERERTRAAQAVAEAELEASSHALVVQIRRAASELDAAAERVKLSAASTAASEDSLSLLRRGLEAGELGLLDVTVARERFLAAEVAALAARADYEQAWLELERAVGEVVGGEP